MLKNITKFFKNRTITMAYGKMNEYIGIACYAIGILLVLMGLFSGELGLGISLAAIPLLGGYFFKKQGKKATTEVATLRLYVPIIVNQNVRKIDTIAIMAGKTYEAAHADIEMLIKKGYLKKARIDEKTRTVVLPEKKTSLMASIGETLVHQKNTKASNTAPAQQNNTAPAKKWTFTCPCCGADNEFYGSEGECEYCGHQVKVRK